MSEHGNFIHDVTPEIAGMYAHLNLPVPPLVDMSNTDTENVLQGNIFISSEEEAAFMAQIMPDSVASRWSPLLQMLTRAAKASR